MIRPVSWERSHSRVSLYVLNSAVHLWDDGEVHIDIGLDRHYRFHTPVVRTRRWWRCPDCGSLHSERHGHHFHPESSWGAKGERMMVLGLAVRDREKR